MSNEQLLREALQGLYTAAMGVSTNRYDEEALDIALGNARSTLAAQPAAGGKVVAYRLRDEEASTHYGKDVYVYWSENEFRDHPNKPKLLALLEPLYTTPLASQDRVKCDGNHGGPRCADPECWNDDAPASHSQAQPTSTVWNSIQIASWIGSQLMHEPAMFERGAVCKFVRSLGRHPTLLKHSPASPSQAQQPSPKAALMAEHGEYARGYSVGYDDGYAVGLRQVQQPSGEVFKKLRSAASLAWEAMEKHRQFEGEAPSGMLGVRAMEELREALRLAVTFPDAASQQQKD